MNLTIPPFLLYIASWLGVTGGIWALFERAEAALSTEAKASISRWLQNLEPGTALAHWPIGFAAAFDSVFGTRHFTRRCFARSCVASVASVFIVSLVYIARKQGEFVIVEQQATMRVHPVEFFLYAVVGASILNFLPDYLSLLETRYVIHLMSRARSTSRLVTLLMIDLAATATIFLGALLAIAILMQLGVYSGLPESTRPSLHVVIWSRITAAVSDYLFEQTVYLSGILGIYFYAAFFTSVWAWLYALSTFAVRLVEYLGLGISRLKLLLDIKEKPLRSIGFVSNIFVTLMYLAAAFLR